MSFTAAPSDIDVVRNAAAWRSQSMFSAQALAANAGVGVGALEKFLQGARLAPTAMEKLVSILFQDRARWDSATQSLIDTPKPVTPMMDTSDLPHGATSASARRADPESGDLRWGVEAAS